MIRTLSTVLLALLCLAGITLWAQQKAAPKGQGGEHAHKMVYPNVFLGQYEFGGGAITAADFNRMLKKGLTSKDSMGNKYKVLGFDFTYAERQLYEDSASNLKMMVDYLFEYCPADTVTSNISASIYERIKPGDTIFISKVRVVKYLPKSNKTLPDTAAILAKGLKCFIVK